MKKTKKILFQKFYYLFWMTQNQEFFSFKFKSLSGVLDFHQNFQAFLNLH